MQWISKATWIDLNLIQMHLWIRSLLWRRRGVPRIYSGSPRNGTSQIGEWTPSITIWGVTQQALIWNPIFLLGPCGPWRGETREAMVKDQNFPLHHRRNPPARKKNCQLLLPLQLQCKLYCPVEKKKHYNKSGPNGLFGLSIQNGMWKHFMHCWHI